MDTYFKLNDVNIYLKKIVLPHLTLIKFLIKVNFYIIKKKIIMKDNYQIIIKKWCQNTSFLFILQVENKLF